MFSSRALRPWLIPLLLIPLSVGYLVGWLVGASQTPVVATTLPLIFGLLGAVAFNTVSKNVLGEAYYDELIKIESIQSLDKLDKIKIRKKLATSPDGTTWLPTYWAIGVLIFIIFCRIGITSGINDRLDSYEPLKTAIERNKLEQIQPLDYAAIYRMRWYLKSAGLSSNEFNSMFDSVIVPILKAESSEDDSLHSNLEQAIEILTKDSKFQISSAPTPYHGFFEDGWQIELPTWQIEEPPTRK